MDTLLQMAQSIESPFVMALVLGVVFALDPCLILTNVAAIGYVGKDIGNKYKVFSNGIMYTIGRTLGYGLLGTVLVWLLRQGGNISGLEHFFDSYGQLILIIFLIVVGVLLLLVQYIPGLSMNVSTEKLQGRISRSSWGSFVLGVVLTFAFCPTNALLFFGMLIPLSATSVQGFVVPFVFAFATALPIIILAWIFSFSLNRIARVYDSMKRIGVVVRWIVAILFIVIGVYLAISTYVFKVDHHHHHHDGEEQLDESGHNHDHEYHEGCGEVLCLF